VSDLEFDLTVDGSTLRDAELEDVIHYFVYNAERHADLVFGYSDLSLG
jgi:hypothetical protein